MDTKTQAGWQILFLGQKSDMYYLGRHKPLKHKQSRKQKDFKTETNPNLFTNTNSGNGGQSSQTLGQFSE